MIINHANGILIAKNFLIQETIVTLIRILVNFSYVFLVPHTISPIPATPFSPYKVTQTHKIRAEIECIANGTQKKVCY